MINHYPIAVSRATRRIPKSCADQTGTCDPFAAITCGDCRQRLQVKVTAHVELAAQYKQGSQNQRFFAGDAAHYQAILDE
jgi:hypothetical protein